MSMTERIEPIATLEDQFIKEAESLNGLKVGGQFVSVGEFRGRHELKMGDGDYLNLAEAEFACSLFMYLRLQGY